MKICHVVFSTNRLEYLKKTFDAQKKFDYSGLDVHKLFIDDYPMGRDDIFLEEFVKQTHPVSITPLLHVKLDVLYFLPGPTSFCLTFDLSVKSIGTGHCVAQQFFEQVPML